jgi:hypothetical protein
MSTSRPAVTQDPLALLETLVVHLEHAVQRQSVQKSLTLRSGR